jgi:hypothetical protein
MWGLVLLFWVLLGSDIIYLDVLGTSIIVLNSEKAAREMFERSIYNDRYHLLNSPLYLCYYYISY